MSLRATLNTAQTLYRVQAADGRGPWRPGFSAHWADANRENFQADIVSAFGTGWLKKLPHKWHAGCACRTLDGLLKWFTTLEQSRLESMGYAPVAILVDLILAENEDQVVFARRDPLSENVVQLAWRIAA